MNHAFCQSIDKMNGFGSIHEPFLVLVDFECEKPIVFSLSSINAEWLRYNFRGVTNFVAEPLSKSLVFEKQPVSFQRYQTGFDAVKRELNYGNTFLLNLTFPTPIRCNLSLQEMHQIGSAPYRLWYKDEFVVFSPECFVRIRDNIISTFPMKGTAEWAEDEKDSMLVHSQKEMAEHATVVDLLRNDLSLVASNVVVKKFRYAEKIETSQSALMQISSEISGDLKPNWHANIGSIIAKMLPAGSVSGAPKPQTCDIIRKTEGHKRGWYTGIMGLYDGQSFDSAVMIRYIEQCNNQLQFRSGGGITHLSNATDEYNEMITKVYLPG